jgi:ATP-dependent DNA helicase RecG
VPVTALKGVGAALGAEAGASGLETLQDLLFHLPLRYQDRTRITPIGALRPGQDAVVEGRWWPAPMWSWGGGAACWCGCRTAAAPSACASFTSVRRSAAVEARHPGALLRRGAPGASGLEIYHPEYRLLSGDEPIAVEQSLTPIYPTTEGLTQQRLRNLSEQALARLDPHSLPDWLPRRTAREYQLPAGCSTPALPAPPTAGRRSRGMAERPPLGPAAPGLRGAADPSAVLQRLRESVRSWQAPALPSARGLQARFLAQLGFRPTGAQRGCATRSPTTCASDAPMLRLVQGDVGAGKTVVAAMAALQAIEAAARWR